MSTYVDIIANEIHAAGWSYGHVSYIDRRVGKLVWVADAHKDGQRCVAKGETW